MLEHGGRLRQAAQHRGVPLAGWLDLSTGIAPWSYPVRIDEPAWRRLPEDDDDLVAVAAEYYGHPQPLPLPGSQAAIRELPRLLVPGVAVLPAPTYGEYAPAWRAAGYEVRELGADALPTAEADVVMLANPNNPDGAGFAPQALRALAERQAVRGGWLVVDEAFADASPQASVAALAGTELPNLIVLRSLGKFFGLAGARVGFLCGAPVLRARLAEALGPWALAHPSRIAATQALSDTAWQQAQRARLGEASARLGRLLLGYGLASRAGGELFRYVPTPQAAALAEHCARRGILLREFDAPPALRFGLPGGDAEWARLAQALDDFDWNRS